MSRLKFPLGLFEDDRNRPVIPGTVVRLPGRQHEWPGADVIRQCCGRCGIRDPLGMDNGDGECRKKRGTDGMPLFVRFHDGSDCDLFEADDE